MVYQTLSIRTLILLGLMVVFGGCRTPKTPPPRPDPQPELSGEHLFASTGLLVTATVSPPADPRPRPDEGDGTSSRPAPRGKGERPAGPPPGAGESRGNAGGGNSTLRADRTPTRQLLTVTVHNPGPESVRLRVAEVKSPLGSFVPVPDIFTLEPGGSQTLEVMRGRAPYNFEQVDLSVRIRTADTNDTAIISLTPVSPPAE